MSVQAGQSLLHYRLIEQIGEGGMGVVWKAEDTSLHREVAIKVLPAAVSQNPERLARFDREAKLLASLNHANIASIYGLHAEGDTRFLAMEFVQGEDLAKRLVRGPMPVSEALGIARQVADALQSAHESGVVHRDLKPANIVLTSDGKPKVLDFGLAKALEADPSDPANPSLSPTLTSAGTMAGVILGTAAYMSPEQARGEPADKRSDVWAFGCVLFEMLVGRMTFKERTVSDTLASVLKVEPDWDLLPTDVPERVVRLLQRCVQKDPRQRLHDIADARIEIEDILAAPLQARTTSQTAPAPRSWVRLALATALLLLGATVGIIIGRGLSSSVPDLRVRRFFLPVAAGKDQEVLHLHGPVISPDGRTIVYAFDDKLWLRDLDQVKPRPLDGTEDAKSPFWSPDGSQIAYLTEDSVWRIPATGGQPTLVCARGSGFAASWGANQTIVFADRSGMSQVPARGGEPKVLFEADSKTEDDFHDAHQLPDGRGVVFALHRREGVDSIGLWADGKRETLVTLESSWLSDPWYSSTGHILFARTRKNEGVWALPFSLSSLEVTGEPFLVVPEAGSASTSADGTLVYTAAGTRRRTELVWFDAEGTVLGTIGQPQDGILAPALSPDGTRVAVVAEENDDWDIWIHDASRDAKNRLTFDSQTEGHPIWSPDGKRLFYHHPESGEASLYAVEADGSGEPRLLGEGAQTTVSRSGTQMVFNRSADDTGSDLWWMAVEDDNEPAVFLRTDADEMRPALSPDGRHVAYVSDESGRNEIYITRFPEGSGKWQVSVDGGSRVFWSPIGDRVFFIFRWVLMEVEVSTDPVIRLGTPRIVVDGRENGLDVWRGIDVSDDGTRFVGIQSVEDDEEDKEKVDPGLHVVENWFSEFKD